MSIRTVVRMLIVFTTPSVFSGFYGVLYLFYVFNLLEHKKKLSPLSYKRILFRPNFAANREFQICRSRALSTGHLRNIKDFVNVSVF